MGTITIPKVCLECKAHIRVVVDSVGYSKWIRGSPVQIAFPDLDVDRRELLVSSICGKCFDKLFEEDKDEDAQARDADEGGDAVHTSGEEAPTL